eukprot:gene15172-biopygen2043
MLRVLYNLYQGAQRVALHDGAVTGAFTSNVGLHEGDVISPTLYLFFIDDLLREVWTKHPGVTVLGSGGDTPAQFVAAMQADDFVAVCDSIEEARAVAQTVVLPWQKYVSGLLQQYGVGGDAAFEDAIKCKSHVKQQILLKRHIDVADADDEVVNQPPCPACGAPVEDEYHLLFECDAYNPVRQWFAPLFVCCGGLDDAGRVNRGVLDPCDVRVFMSQHPRRVAAFIHECFAWRAQEVRLPPYVPAAYMLDTFSSSVSELMVVDDDDVEIHS